MQHTHSHRSASVLEEHGHVTVPLQLFAFFGDATELEAPRNVSLLRQIRAKSVRAFRGMAGVLNKIAELSVGLELAQLKRPHLRNQREPDRVLSVYPL